MPPSRRSAKRLYLEHLEPRLMLAGDTLVETGLLDLLQGADNPLAEITTALIQPNSGIEIVSDSARFVGRIGDGTNPNTAQSALFTDLELVSNNSAQPTIQLPGPGLLLTSGVANLPSSNTMTDFDAGSLGIDPPDAPSPGDEAALSQILADHQLQSVVNNLNVFEFQFTVAEGITSIEADFVFGSDEFPEQSVTDIFAFIVDGENYAVFSDGSLVSFIKSNNDGNFNNNTAGIYAIEYDGISNVLHVVGLLDLDVPVGGAHTLKIAIANTSDQSYDSGVFIANLVAGNSRRGGIDPPVVPSIDPGAIIPLPSVDEPVAGPPIAPLPVGPPLLLVVTTRDAATVAPLSDAGSGGGIPGNEDPATAPPDVTASGGSAEVIDAVWRQYELAGDTALASFLDFVDPDLLIVELGDEPPAKLAPDHDSPGKAQPNPIDSTEGAANPNRHSNGEEVTYLKPTSESGADGNSGEAGVTIRSFLTEHWRPLVGAMGFLLTIGSAAWVGRNAWRQHTRRIRTR